MSSAVSASRPTRWRREEGTVASKPGTTELLSLRGSESNWRDLALDFFTGELADTQTGRQMLRTDVDAHEL